jgi:hypothetical protein
MNIMSIIKRFREPSTWAGLAGLAAIFGAPASVVEPIMTAVNVIAGAGVATPVGIAQSVGALFALAAVLLPEEKPPLLIVRTGTTAA